ncbi:MAG: pitrilysin family protein [Actinomycetota bacterium]|nr:pitrilysin family protein [Actinomycetota bacterium]
MIFSKTQLESGIRVITETISHVRSVALGFWVGIGARDEPEKYGGMSHFLEHLLFKGTAKYPARKISETFEALGGELNAFSAKEYTCFHARILDEHLPVAVEVLSDMLQRPLFKEGDIVSEKEVVLEEISLHGDTPDEQIHDLFVNALWENHPLGRSALGDAETVRSFTRGDVQDFFSRGYATKNILIAAAGHLDHKEFVDLVQKHFADNGGRSLTRREIIPTVKSRVKVHRKQTEQAHLCYGTQGLHARHDDRFALAILDNILGGGMSSRLFQEIRENRGLVYSIYSYHSLYSEAGLMAVYAGTRPSKAEEVLRLIQKEIDDLVKNGVSPEELHRAKEHLKGHLVLSLENTNSRMARLGKSELVHREILSLDELVEKIDGVTVEDMQRVAETLFGTDRMVLTAIGPLEEEKLARWMRTEERV